jgi:hypothetical protein
MRRALAFLASIVALAACSSGGDQTCTLTAIGASCMNDTDCCSGYCQLEGNGAYCQQKPKTPQACVGPTGFCTQDRNCCSGLCQNGACFSGGGGSSCLSIGSTCLQPDSCCSVNCIPDGLGGTACAPQPQPDGGSCGLPGTGCSAPGQDDPGECCFGLCGFDSTCAGGGGGGGPNCGGSGAFCRYGTDCCSGQCEQLSSTSACK